MNGMKISPIRFKTFCNDNNPFSIIGGASSDAPSFCAFRLQIAWFASCNAIGNSLNDDSKQDYSQDYGRQLWGICKGEFGVST